MKKILHLIDVVIIVGCTMVAGGGCQSVHISNKFGESKVVRLEGEARFSMGRQGEWQELKLGDLIPEDSVIQISHRGSIFVSVGNASKPISQPDLGGLPYSPFVYEYNLIRIASDGVCQIRPLKEDVAFDGVKESAGVLIKWYAGDLLGNVSPNCGIYELRLTNGITIRFFPNTVYELDSDCRLALYRGKADIRGVQWGKSIGGPCGMDMHTGQSFDLPPIADRLDHDIWLPSDPMLIPWAKVK